MKKLFALLMALVMVLSLASCGRVSDAVDSILGSDDGAVSGDDGGMDVAALPNVDVDAPAIEETPSTAGDPSEIDAIALVQGWLDVVYFGECSDYCANHYGISASEARDHYEYCLTVEADWFIEYFQIVADYIDDDTYEDIVDMYSDIYPHSRYEVGEATLEGDTYYVDVTIWPIDVIYVMAEKEYDYLVDEWNDDLNANRFDTQAEAEQVWAERVMDTMDDYVDDIGYQDPVVVTVEVGPDADGFYDILNFSEVDNYVIAY